MKFLLFIALFCSNTGFASQEILPLAEIMDMGSETEKAQIRSAFPDQIRSVSLVTREIRNRLVAPDDAPTFVRFCNMDHLRDIVKFVPEIESSSIVLCFDPTVPPDGVFDCIVQSNGKLLKIEKFFHIVSESKTLSCGNTASKEGKFIWSVPSGSRVPGFEEGSSGMHFIKKPNLEEMVEVFLSLSPSINQPEIFPQKTTWKKVGSTFSMEVLM